MPPADLANSIRHRYRISIGYFRQNAAPPARSPRQFGDDKQESWWKHVINSTFPQERIEREKRHASGG